MNYLFDFIFEGIFKETCKLLAKYHTDFRAKFENQTTNFTSWYIQNDLIQYCGEHVRAFIFKEICEAKMFAIMCDEARFVISIP